MSHSKSSRRWLKEHFSDKFVKQAKVEGYRGRAAYKLVAMQEKDRILRPGMVVVDLGAAPGAWSQVAVNCVGETGQVFALDILPMDGLVGVNIMQGDFTDEQVEQQLLAALKGLRVDVIMSDMAPNLSGSKTIDQPRVMLLIELALDFARKVLKPGGTFLVKAFHGSGFDDYLRILRGEFNKVLIRKPEASRSRSSEQYLLGLGFKNRK